MCNLYSLTKGQAAIHEWFRAGHDRTGNLSLFPGIFPDQMVPIVRTGEDRPLFAFAGLWASWHGVRGPKSAPVQGEHQLFGFLTTEANAIVAPIHPKAMPVILDNVGGCRPVA